MASKPKVTDRLDLTDFPASFLRACVRITKCRGSIITADLTMGAAIDAGPEHSHYLLNVLRMTDGGEVLVFNGRDGEWRAAVEAKSKKAARLKLIEQTRPQPPTPDLVYCFAPLKQGRLDYLVQKAVEMGAGILQPVITQHTQVAKPVPTAAGQRDRSRRAVRHIGGAGGGGTHQTRPAARRWEKDRRLIFCDEDASTNNPLPALQATSETKLGLLIGPEGGFSDVERRHVAVAALRDRDPARPAHPARRYGCGRRAGSGAGDGGRLGSELADQALRSQMIVQQISLDRWPGISAIKPPRPLWPREQV